MALPSYDHIARAYWHDDQHETDEEHAERVERCTVEAKWYFDSAVSLHKAIFDNAMKRIVDAKGSPRWDRQRTAAKKAYEAAYKQADALFLHTFECLMQSGEVSDELSNEWTALDGVRQIEVAA